MDPRPTRGPAWDPIGTKRWLITYESMTFVLIGSVLPSLVGFLLVTCAPCSAFYPAGCPDPFEYADYPANLAGLIVIAIAFAIRLVRSSDYRGPRVRETLSRGLGSSRPVKVLCIAGMPGCGKEEVLAVAQDLGFSIVRMGDVVREEAARRGLPITDAAVGSMAHEERQVHGFGVWAERTLPRIRGDRVLVDGIRGRAELDVFRKAFGEDLVVLAVHASPRTRHERMLRRRRADDAEGLEALRVRDSRELSWGLGDVIATADIVVVNELSLESFRAEVRTILQAI